MTVRLSNLTSRWVPGTAPNVAFNMQVLDSGADMTTSKFFNYSMNSVNRISGYANGRLDAAALSVSTRINLNAGAIVMYSNGMIVANGSLFITGNVNVSGIIVSGNAGVDLTGVFVVANTANVQANQAFIQANAAYLVANTGNLYSNLAFRAANAAFGVINLHNSTMTSMNVDIDAAFARANLANGALANTEFTGLLQQDFSTVSTSLVDVTNFSIPVAPNKTYKIELMMAVQPNVGTATTVGFLWGVNFPTGCYPKGLRFSGPTADTTMGWLTQQTDGIGDHSHTVIGHGGVGLPVLTVLTGFVVMRTNAAGTIDARFAIESPGGHTLLSNSAFSYKIIS